ncbi:MAG: Maf-like protein [Bacteroidaceae bacterium]|nr:Maf-like protein [Bacteroidaceae bacterium]
MISTSKRIILGSNSPRRRELLSGLGIDYTVRVVEGIDESYPDTLAAEDIPQYISRKKAAAYDLSRDELLITADTIVWRDGRVLGKPASRAAACRMLESLSAATHQVITGVTLTTLETQRTFCSVSDVTFGPLAPREIEYYVDNFRPYDKAGAYGIQEWIGYVAVTSLRGSYFNVMGLPIQRLYSELKSMGILEV